MGLLLGLVLVLVLVVVVLVLVLVLLVRAVVALFKGDELMLVSGRSLLFR